MNVSHLFHAIQDQQNGELLVGAQVKLCAPGTQTAISAPIFADSAMSQQLANPFVVDDGIIDVYLEYPITVCVIITYGAVSTLVDYVSILPMAETIFTSPTPLSVTNSPGTRLFLSGVDTENVQWVSLDNVYALIDTVLLGWFMSSAFAYANIVRDSNGVMETADVFWPDGTTGTYTADQISGTFIGKVDAWHVSWADNESPRTYFQPAITRDGNGNSTSVPTPVVVNGIVNSMS